MEADQSQAIEGAFVEANDSLDYLEFKSLMHWGFNTRRDKLWFNQIGGKAKKTSGIFDKMPLVRKVIVLILLTQFYATLLYHW